MVKNLFNSWIVCPRPNKRAKIRLFCFPYAGGGASFFTAWQSDTPEHVELCCIQLPGRENRLGESLVTRLPDLTQSLTRALRPHLDMPYTFFGHSMGALLSFELARQFRREKMTGPLSLFVSGRHAPQVPARHQPIYNLPDHLFIHELRQYDGMPEIILNNPELMNFFLPLLRADFILSETYRYTFERPLQCAISAFGGAEDRRVSKTSLDAWRDQTEKRFTLRMFSGNHFYLLKNQRCILDAITSDLHSLLGGI